MNRVKSHGEKRTDCGLEAVTRNAAAVAKPPLMRTSSPRLAPTARTPMGARCRGEPLVESFRASPENDVPACTGSDASPDRRRLRAMAKLSRARRAAA
jgi:hypothetical protein